MSIGGSAGGGCVEAISIRSTPGRPAHAGRVRAADLLGQVVVAPAAADAVFCAASSAPDW